MSRIQEILAKAEREGTARRTQSGTSFAAPPPSFTPTSAPSVDGTSVLYPAPFAPTPPGASVDAAPEPRSATVTLHPALIAAINPHSKAAEEYRSLRTRLGSHEDGSAVRALLVTSPGEGDGKSITAANLALTMAQELQRRVVLIDGDLRHGVLHALFGLDEAPGLAELLSGEASLEDVLVFLPEIRLTILPSGRAPEFPTELLGSSAMRRAIDTLRARFDRVLIDMPAVMPLADVSAVAPMADGVLMVIHAGITQRPLLDQALGAFEDGKVLGVVLNDMGGT
jgi:capsular exopolysaccharide synthesis family protein